MAGALYRVLLWSTLIALTFFTSPSHGYQLTAWTHEKGTFLAYQSPGKAAISYSYCNMGHQIILPEGAPNDLLLAIPPKVGTSLASDGGYGGEGGKTVWAMFFYQSENDAIVETFFLCNITTGLYHPYSSRVIKNTPNGDTWLDVSPRTGLAVVFSRDGSDDIYHLYYQNSNYAIQQVYWTSKDNLTWTPSSLSGAYVLAGGLAMDVAYSKALDKHFVLSVSTGSARMQVSNEIGDGQWNTTTLPANGEDPIPYWSGTPSSLGLTVNATGCLTIYYIGTDNRLHRMLVDGNYVVRYPDDTPVIQKHRPRPNPKAKFLPDTTPFNGGPDSSLAIAANTDSNDAMIFWENTDSGISGLAYVDGQLSPKNPVTGDPYIGGDMPTLEPTATESGIPSLPTGNDLTPNGADDGNPAPTPTSTDTSTSDCNEICEEGNRRYTGMVMGSIFGIFGAVCVATTLYFVYKRWQGRRSERRHWRDWRPSPNAERIVARPWTSLNDWLHETKNEPAPRAGGGGRNIPMVPVVAGAAAVGAATVGGAALVGSNAAGVAIPSSGSDLPIYTAPQDPDVSPVSARSTLHEVSPSESMVSVSLPRISEETQDEGEVSGGEAVTGSDDDGVSVDRSAVPSITPSLATSSEVESYDGEEQVAQIGIAI